MLRQCKNEKTVFYSQRDNRWRDQIMTQADPQKDYKYRSWKDTLGVFGCLTTCISNVFEILMNKKFTPKDTNDIFGKIKAYRYLLDPTCEEGRASEIVWERVQEHFDSIQFSIHVKEYQHDQNAYYIGELAGRFHFVNVLAVKPGYHGLMNYIVYDVWDGYVKLLCKEDFDYFHVIKLKG